jgi:hypothetical protein
MNKDLFAWVSADSPKPSKVWLAWSPSERGAAIRKCIDSDHRYAEALTFVEARADGQVILNLHPGVEVFARCDLLLDFEELLKEKVEAANTVWLEPIGDKSTLRRLRGIEVRQ